MFFLIFRKISVTFWCNRDFFCFGCGYFCFFCGEVCMVIFFLGGYIFFSVVIFFFLGGCFGVGGDEKYGCLWLFMVVYMVIFFI